MALTEYTITIINKNTDPTLVGDGYKPLVVISPTGITTPQTPYDEWVADSETILSGAVSIPAWKKLQYFIIPASSKLVIMTDIADEAIYYQELIGKITNVDITVSTAPIVTYGLSISYATAPVQGGSAASVTATTTPSYTLTGAVYTVDVGDTVATIDASTGALTAKAGTSGQVVTVTVTGNTGASDGNIPVTATTKVTIAES